MNATRITIIAVALLGSALAVRAALSPPPAIKHTDLLERQDLESSPGREVVQLRNDFDSGAAFGRHWHPGEEIIYVVSGTFVYDVDGQAPRTLEAGSSMLIPAGVIHSARNTGADTAAEVSTYVVKKGAPLTVMVK